MHRFIKLDFQMSIDLVLTKRELSFFQILPSLNMIVFPNILVNVSTLYHSRPDFLKKNTTIIEYDCISQYFGKCQHFVLFRPEFSEKIFSSSIIFSSHERNWDKKSWAILKNFNYWMIDLQLCKNIYFAHGNLARLVYWPIYINKEV